MLGPRRAHALMQAYFPSDQQCQAWGGSPSMGRAPSFYPERAATQRQHPTTRVHARPTGIHFRRQHGTSTGARLRAGVAALHTVHPPCVCANRCKVTSDVACPQGGPKAGALRGDLSFDEGHAAQRRTLAAGAPRSAGDWSVCIE